MLKKGDGRLTVYKTNLSTEIEAYGGDTYSDFTGYIFDSQIKKKEW